MSWIDKEFEAKADQSGVLAIDQTISSPFGGKIKAYRVETLTDRRGRNHQTTLVITRVDDPSDNLHLGPINVADNVESSGSIDPPYRVRSGKNYRIVLNSAGFDANEGIHGKAGVDYVLFLD